MRRIKKRSREKVTIYKKAKNKRANSKVKK